MTVWLLRETVLAIQDEQLAEHGGAAGVRDEGLLESALARPLDLGAYGQPDVAELAATYALGITRNRPFVGGNKRNAYVALETFIRVNGLRFPVPDAVAVVVMQDLAAGEMTDGEFIAWVRENVA